MKKILIASDLHGSRSASEKLVLLDTEYNFERIILLGDINYSGARNIPPKDYYPIDVCNNLLKIAEKLTIIRGNCDSRVDEFVLKIPFKDLLIEEINGHKFFMTHGDLYIDDSFKYHPLDVFLYGHTHIYKLDKHEDGHFEINPGSTTLPKGGNEASYIIYDLDSDSMTLYNMADKVIKTLELK